jgi:quercetin dioxygenase-like cupin family protein
MPVSDYPLAESIVQVDNPTARVTAWHFTPGSSTGHHRHEYDYVVVPLSTGRLRIRSADGEAPGELIAGQAYFRQSGVEHEVINDNDFEIAFVEIEFKKGAQGC